MIARRLERFFLRSASASVRLDVRNAVTLAPTNGTSSSRSPTHSCTPRLVIFDKDGTLICFDSLWVPWAQCVAQRLSQLCGRDVAPSFFRTLGFCAREGRVRSGLLAQGTMAQIREQTVRLLTTHGSLEPETAQKVVYATLTECRPSETGAVKPLHDLHSVMGGLRTRGVKVAVCTADSRFGTLSTLKQLRVEPFVDVVVCGDDEGTKPKPHPHNALAICDRLQIAPQETVMVGDTLADLGMARAAGLGISVGVLSGVGERHELAPHADHLIAHVGELVPLLFPGSMNCSQKPIAILTRNEQRSR